MLAGWSHVTGIEELQHHVEISAHRIAHWTTNEYGKKGQENEALEMLNAAKSAWKEGDFETLGTILTCDAVERLTAPLSTLYDRMMPMTVGAMQGVNQTQRIAPALFIRRNNDCARRGMHKAGAIHLTWLSKLFTGI